MCSQGGGKVTHVNTIHGTLVHKCYLCDHNEAIKEIKRLNKKIQKLKNR